MVPETKHTQAAPFDLGGAPCIVRLVPRLVVLAAVQFDHQAPIDADEVGDVVAEGMLAAELAAGHTAVAQEVPQARFGIGGGMAHGAGERGEAVVAFLGLA